MLGRHGSKRSKACRTAESSRAPDVSWEGARDGGRRREDPARGKLMLGQRRAGLCGSSTGRGRWRGKAGKKKKR